jgi:hypothetical protein
MKDNLGTALKALKKVGKKGITVRQLFDLGINDVYGCIKKLRRKGHCIYADQRENLKTGVKFVEYVLVEE